MGPATIALAGLGSLLLLAALLEGIARYVTWRADLARRRAVRAQTAKAREQGQRWFEERIAAMKVNAAFGEEQDGVVATVAEFDQILGGRRTRLVEVDFYHPHATPGWVPVLVEGQPLEIAGTPGPDGRTHLPEICLDLDADGRRTFNGEPIERAFAAGVLRRRETPGEFQLLAIGG